MPKFAKLYIITVEEATLFVVKWTQANDKLIMRSHLHGTFYILKSTITASK